MSDSVYCECGQSFEGGAELSDHIEEEGGLSDDHQPASEPQPDAEASDGLREELGTVLPGKDPLSNLTVVRTGMTVYTVLSARNGSVTRHKVTLDPADCTCGDWEYNLDGDDRDVCAHYAAAVLDGSDVETSDIAINEIASLTKEARELSQDAQAALEGASEANVAARETEAAAVQEATDEEVANAEPDGQAEQEAAGDAAQRLREAYENVDGLTDMQVQAHAGHVWVQTGQDTPDELDSGPVTIDVWEQFISNPDQVMYIYESDDGPDHDLFSEKPGEWWKNALEPGDVDQYIEEVLGVAQ